jgi:hypothetical protein
MQKTLLFLILSCCSLLPAMAQNSSWGLNIMPGISYRLPQTGGLSLQAESIQNGEQPMYTFDFGLDLRQQLSGRLGLGTGIIYSQKGFSNNHLSAVYAPNISRRYLIDYVQQYLEIPIFLTYDLSRRKEFSFYPLAGLSNSLLISHQNELSVRSGELSRETADLIRQPYLQSPDRHSLSLLGGFGIMAEVDDKSALGVEALAKLMFNPLRDRVSLTRRHLYTLGINFRFVRRIH